MSKKTRIIILSVLAVLIVVVLSVSITTAFMKPIDQGGNITEVSLSSCAKIKLEGTTSIKLTNSYPMSRNRGLQTTPYTFTVTSYCDTYVGFNLYLATLNTNTLAASNIHYIITKKGSKEALVEGTLTSSLDDASNFTDAEKTELNAGLSGTYGNIFKLYNNKVPYKGSTTYDLYLFVDENATEYQNTTFAAGVAVKSYEREKTTINEVCSNGNNLASCVTTLAALGSDETAIYYHDNTLANGAGDNSYRYAGASESVNNFVCFGSTTSPCPTDNLYRIIGVFNGKVKLVKYNDIGTFDTSKYNATSFADTEAYNALNSTFIDTFDIRWKNMISTENWISGIVSSSSVSKLNFKNNNINVKFLAGSATSPLTINWYTAKNWYIVESGAEHKLSMKIGTISISELRYAMNSSNWNLSTLDNTSWLYYSKNEAFYLFECFTDNTISDTMGYYMTTDGILYAYISPTKISPLEYITTYVRPSFYLVSSVLYKSGIGTSYDAIYITD